ncbi:tetr bacterial regulatory protein hth signature [Lucifera butyrica]|uniref:Tetr bacterial regulatory protein hth signature n=1 Tax=Lucifera butyrica TaxID=1351585 RepID=A0A498R5H2_9FIRM|nr:TetR/AcrR family transcriptional regulator [Lucifera butyrica]VBB06355.1 tetr bacterial regulatory protein hth signature [Lucifera butyrica]
MDDMEKDSSAKLLEAASKLFAERGFAAVSIREVAEAASVNSALISYHFGGKEGLYSAVLEMHLSKVASTIAAIDDQNLTPLDRIKKFGLGVMGIHRRFPYFRRYLYGELSNPTTCLETVVKKHFGRAYQVLHAILQEGIECGQIRAGIDPAFATIALVGIVNFYFIGEPIFGGMLPSVPDRDEKHVLQALDIFIHGVRRNQHE